MVSNISKAEPDGYLLKGGTVIGASDTDTPLTGHDILIIGDTITNINPNIQPPAAIAIEIIDCTDRIVAPGFVSTHNHLWQTQLKGRHGDDSQLDFNRKGNAQASRYTPADAYLGTLAACLECIDAGVTTVVDNANIVVAPAYSLAALAALCDSQIRGTFCYTMPALSEAEKAAPSFSSSGESQDPADSRFGFPTWAVEQLRRIRTLPLPPRISLGLSADRLTSQDARALRDCLLSERYFANEMLFIAHWGVHPAFADSDEHRGFPAAMAQIAREHPSQMPRAIVGHGCEPGSGSTLAANLFPARERLAHVGVPYAEASLGLGRPLIGGFIDPRTHRTSLGIGCHSINAADMFVQMRTALTLSRIGSLDQETRSHGAGAQLRIGIRDVFDLATKGGADALGRPDLGRLRRGCKADVVIYETSSIQMSLAAEEDPYTAVVNYAAPSDIDTVFVDGKIRKRRGTLNPVAVPYSIQSATVGVDEELWWHYLRDNSMNGLAGAGVQSFGWPELRTALKESRSRINRRIAAEGSIVSQKGEA